LRLEKDSRHDGVVIPTWKKS